MNKNEIPRPGDRIGQYELTRVIGAGGMGVVYEARDGEQRVALKLMQPQRALHPDTRERHAQRMAREFSVMLPLRHPNVVRVLAFGCVEGLPWFAMEFVEGETLDAWMDANPEPVAVATLFRKLSAGLSEVHRLGLVHRDLKPSNVMVRPDGEPVLIDFGVVHSAAAPTLTTTCDMPGTKLYASPELVAWSNGPRRTAFRYTPAYDVHALGVMLYEALTGRYPFRSRAYNELGSLARESWRERPRHPSDVAPRVPRALGDLCMQMLARSPSRRPRDGGCVEVALSTLELGGAPPPWLLHARVVFIAALAIALLKLAIAWAPSPPPRKAPPVSPPPAARAVDVPPPALQPALLPESPAMPSHPLAAAPPQPAAPKPPAPAPKSVRKGLEHGAVLLTTCAVLGGCHAEVQREGALTHCPPASKTVKPLGIPAGYQFDVCFLEKDRKRMDQGLGPPRVGLEKKGRSPRYLVPTNEPVEMEFCRPVPQLKALRAYDLDIPILPGGSHLYALARQGPERVEFTFTRLVLPDGSERPMCAVGLDAYIAIGGERGLPTPVPPPAPPPGSLFVDTWVFTAQLMEPL